MRAAQRCHSGRVLGFLVALLALVLPAAGASAAMPIDLGAGETSPRVVVDSAGDGHLTWEGRDATHLSEEEVLYCRLDPGATSCSAFKAFGHAAGSEFAGGSAPLLDASGNALVLADRFGTPSNQKKTLYSAAEGFATPHLTATGPIGLVPDFTEALYAPAGTVAATPRVITIDGGPVTGGGRLQATEAIGAATTTGIGNFSVTEGPGGGHSTTTAAIGLAGSTLVTAYIDLDEGNNLEWRQYSGNGSLASLNSSASWSAPANFGVGADNVALAGGPAGLYAAYDAPGSGLVMLVKFTGGGWTAPVPISDSGAVNGWFSLDEDEAGVLHLAWADPSGALRYRYARDASNSSFTNPQTLVAAGGPGFREPHLAVDAAGNGWVGWQEFGGANPAHVFAMAVVPGEPPSPPAPVPPVTPPPPYAGPTKATGVAVGKGLRAVLTTPKACVAGGQSFQAAVGVKRKGSRAHKASYSVPKVSFFLNGKLLLVDKKKPFRATYTTTGIAAGSSLLVTAKISVLLKKGHRHSTVRKTLKARVATC